MIHRRIVVIAAIAIGSLSAIQADSAYAFGSGDDRGATGFSGLLLSSGARNAALGGAGTAIAGESSALLMNPASVASVSRRTASLAVTNYVLDILPAAGIVSYPSGSGVWSVAGSGISYGDFERVDPLAAEDGTFGANDVAVHVGYARFVGGLALGATAGIVRSSIDSYDASAVVFNFGAIWELNDRNTAFALSATNVGTALSSYVGGDQGMKDEVPTAIHVGARHRPEHFPAPLTLLADVDIPRDDESTLSVGVEAKPVDMLTLRVGYDSLVRYLSSDMIGDDVATGLALDDRHTSGFGGLGLRFGTGLVWRDYGLDYAYVPVGPFGSVHHVTARVEW